MWPLALLLLPALALLGRVEPAPRLPAAIVRPGHEEMVAKDVPQERVPGSVPEPIPPPAAERASEEGPAVSQEPPEDLEAWKRWPISSTLVWFAHHQNADGSFGDGPVPLEGHEIGKSGLTSLAVLSCLGYGYSPLSKDVLDGKEIGGMVKRAVAWLTENPRGNGFEQVLSALALSEAYGMTASEKLKEPAKSALEALSRLQGPDGSWIGPGPSAWALLAVRSAELGEIPVPDDVKRRGLLYNERSEHPSSLWNRIALARNREGVDVRAALLATSPPPPDDFAAWYHSAGGVLLCDGREGQVGKPFFELMKQALLTQHEPGGAWPGSSVGHTVLRSSLAMLTLETYWHYRPAVFGEPR